MKKLTLVAVVVSLLLAVFGGATYVYNQQQAEKAAEQARNNAAALVRDYSPRLGNAEGPVILVEFFDPACETCRAFYPFVKKMMTAYPGQIQLVLRYTPFHDRADYVVKLLEAARLQNKYWETLEVVYKTQPVWAVHGNPQPEKLWMYLGKVGLDIQKVKADMNSPEIARRIAQDMSDAQKIGVQRTPTFFVNNIPLNRFGYRELHALVESEVRRAER